MKKTIIFLVAVLVALSAEAQNLTVLHLNDTHSHIDPQRSGEYKRINAMAVKEGELIRYDAFMDEIELKYIEDEEQRQSLPTIGYFAMFEYHNGFRKVLYWSRAKMEQHALQYSQGYRAKKGYTFWEKDFDAMGVKTMLRQLLSKWGMMSLEMQKAYEADGGVLNQEIGRAHV